MKTYFTKTSLTCLTLALCAVVSLSANAETPNAITRLEVNGTSDTPTKLHTQYDRMQLVVTAHLPANKLQDVTHKVTYEVSPPGILAVDKAGRVKPLSNGAATIKIKHPDGNEAQANFQVTGIGDTTEVNFQNRVNPILTKNGCNGGGCHGKSSGQAGFKLSLFGYYPSEDYEHMVIESRGRRLSPGLPDQSLILKKAVNEIPHEGGQRFEVGSYDYQVLHDWIAQGMPYTKKDSPEVTRIEVFPDKRVLQQKSDQQIRVIAYYSDGTHDDVTHVATYESSAPEIGEVDKLGHLQVSNLPGDVAVMVLYQAKVGVFRGTVPLGAPMRELPKLVNYVDEHVFNKLKLLGMPPSNVADDTTFIRRVSVDITGQLPSVEQVSSFLKDTDPAKRDKLVDRLLNTPEYADYFANKWSAVLRNKRKNGQFTRGNFAFYQWVRQSLVNNKPFDQFVSEIITASGEMSANPTIAWYRQVTDYKTRMEDTAQLFLGVRIQCAQCHHHPYERWSMNDYYSFGAFFSRVGTKTGEEFGEARLFHQRGTAGAKNPKNNQTVTPTGLGADPLTIPPDEDPRQHLADWMTNPKNPFFAKSLVNRYWKHFMNRGLVEPEDDIRDTNPPTNPELLDALAANFIKNGYDLKQLIRDITKSKTYQLSAIPNGYNEQDKQNYSRYYPKRLNAEVLLESIDTLSGVPTKFPGLPKETRPVAIPDSGVSHYFLTVFGKPEMSSACECERTSEANLAQSLHLINSKDLYNKLANPNGRAKQLATDKRPDDQKLHELYLMAFSRTPEPHELKLATSHLAKYPADKKHQGWEDIIWAMINTKEFLFNH